MKSVLKLLFLLCLLLVATYATTPLWLPHVVGKQLPEGWQLRSLHSGYPGVSGINIHSIHLDGDIQAAHVTLTARGVRFSYPGFKSEIESISLDIYPDDEEDTIANTDFADRFSLPIMTPTGHLPELSVEQLQLVFHHQRAGVTSSAEVAKPLELVLDAFRLSPGTDGNINVVTDIAVKSSPVAPGKLHLILGADSQLASIRFPNAISSGDWLTLTAEQFTDSDVTRTRIQASFVSEFVNQQWLDSMFLEGSGELVQHVEGELNLHANFSGTDLQRIEDLTLSTENLSFLTSIGLLDVKTALRLNTDEGGLEAQLTAPAELRFRDDTGEVDRLLGEAMPALRRAPRPHSLSLLSLQPGGHFKIGPGDTPSISFSGGFDFKLSSPGETIGIQSESFQFIVDQWPKLDSVQTEGAFQFELKEEVPLSYTMDTMEATSATTVISAAITSADDRLLSSGQGTFTYANLESLATSSEQLTLQWQELDIFSQTGKFTAQTRGFTSSIDEDNWSDFDFDVSFDIVNGEKIRGAGNVILQDGPVFPVMFNGNISEEKWKVSIPTYTIDSSELGYFLSAVHLDLPAAVELSDGSLTLQVQAEIGNKTIATIASQAYQLDASLEETSADDISFSFKYRLDNELSGGGPISIESLALAGGVELRNLRAKLQTLNSNSFDIQDLYAELLGGQLSLSSLKLNDWKVENTQIELSQLDLDLLLQFAHIDGLSGNGKLNISLPVISDDKGIAIKQGTFHAVGPGRLSYSKGEVSTTNIGLQALENFQYESLSGMIDYQTDGSYLITARLEGSNPDLYDGYPVAFNLNISGSLPELFEALFVTGNFGQAMLKVIRKDQ